MSGVDVLAVLTRIADGEGDIESDALRVRAAVLPVLQAGRQVAVTRRAYITARSGSRRDCMSAHADAVDAFCEALARVTGVQA